MPGAYPRYEKGPLTFTVEAAVVGGQLVAVGTGGLVKPAVTADTAVLGVAHIDARPYVEAEHYPDTGYGAPSMDVSVPGEQVSVGFFGAYDLTAAAAVAFGDLVEPAATAGQVQTHTPGTSTGQPVGRCVQASGIAAGESGLILLQLLGPA